jgi:hypothetical protein
MQIRQDFTVEHLGEYQPAFAAAAEMGFDYVELNMEAPVFRSVCRSLGCRCYALRA